MAFEINRLNLDAQADGRPGKYRLPRKLWFTVEGAVVEDGDPTARFLIGPEGRDVSRKFAQDKGIIAYVLETGGVEEPETAERLVARNKRDELVELATAEGVTFDADANKTAIAEAIIAARTAAAEAAAAETVDPDAED